MTSYRLFETRQFQKDLAEIARGGQERLVEKLHAVVYPQLQRQPRIVFLTAAAHRGSAY